MVGQMLHWIWENPNVAASPKPDSQPRIDRRRPHQKSRNGCASCKQKKIKCDETKPQCEQCAHRRIECVYPSSIQSGHKFQAPRPTLSSDSQSLPKQKLFQYMQATQVPCDRLANPKYLKAHALDLFDHWVQTSDAWIGTPHCQIIMQQYALEIALDTDAEYLVHSILAFSACHLNFLQPDDPKWAIASVIHYSQALNLYVQQLQDYVGPENSDQMIGCCTLLEMMAFWNLSKPAFDSAETSSLADDLAALKSMRGSCFLRGTPGIYSKTGDSIWQTVYNMDLCFHGDDDTYFDIDPLAVLPPALSPATIKLLENLCEDGVGVTSKTNIYHVPIQRLKRIMTNPSDREAIGWYMQWAGRLPTEFLQALEREDERALLVLAFWTALFLRVDQWWIGESARSQCLQICQHLELHASPSVLALLEFPSQILQAKMRN